MRRHPSTGQIAHGIAGDGVYVDGTQISPGGGQSGMPDWMGAQVLHCAEQGVTLREADGSTPMIVGVPANFVRASAHGWASWSPQRGVFTSWGLTLPAAVLLDMAPDGTLLVGDNYQSGVGISAYRAGSATPLWRVPTAQTSLRFPYSQASILDEQTACWTEPVNGRQALVGFGLPEGPRPPWDVVDSRILSVNGKPWVVYIRPGKKDDNSDNTVIAHPWDYDGKGFYVQGVCYGCEAWQEGEFLTLAWSIGAGETAGQIKGKPFNLAELETVPSLPVPPPPDKFRPISAPMPKGTTLHNIERYFIPKPGTMPRTGKHTIHWHTDGDRHFFCKFYDPSIGFHSKACYEEFRVGEKFLHQVTDRSQGKPHLKLPYLANLSNTCWFPRTMQIGEEFAWDSGHHEMVEVNSETCQEFNRWGYTRRMGLLDAWDQFEAGRDFPNIPVAKFLYDPTGGVYAHDRHLEVGYQGLDVGPLAWESYRTARDPVTGKPGCYDTGVLVLNEDTLAMRSVFYHKGGVPWVPQIAPCALSVSPEVPPVQTRPMTAAEKSIVNAYAGANPPPHGDGSEGWLDRAYRNLPDGWTAKLCQQLRFSLGANYGHKRRNGSAPLSAGSFAVLEGDMMQVFDILVGVGSGAPRVDVGVESLAVHLTGPEAQEFVDVSPVNHLNIQPPTNRPALTLPLWGVTAFDLAARVSLGDWRFYDLIRANKLVPRVNVYATIDHPATGRLYRTFTTGMGQMRTLLPRMVQDGMKGQFILFVGTTPDGISRSQALDMLRQQNALFQQFASAVAGLQIGNEVVYPGLEEPYLSDPSFCREAEAIIDARFPLTWGAGHGGQPVNMAGGSYLVHHSDRDLSPDAAGAILAEAQRIAKRPVVDDEPRRIEANGGGQSTGDLNFVRGLINNAKRHGYGLTMHVAAGRGCSVDLLDDVQREAIRLTGIEAQTTTPPPIPPQPGHPILDSDMTNDSIWYPIFVVRHGELRNAIIEEYTRLKGHAPHDELIRHYLYRACAERGRWRTLRRAFED